MAVRRRSRRGKKSETRSGAKLIRIRWPYAVLFLTCVGLLVLGSYLTRDDQPTSTPFPSDPGGGTIGVFVLPDDGHAPVLRELDAAAQSITVHVYLLSDDEIMSALERAHARGVEVRVMLEEHPFGGAGLNPRAFDRLTDAGIAVRWSNPVFRFSHIKTIVVDRAVAIVMNLNLTASAFEGNREFGVVTTRPGEVAQAVAIFEADWARTEEPPAGPLVVSPTTSRRELLGLIGAATRTIDIYAEVVRDEEILAALTAAEERGVAVRLIMSEESGDDDRGVSERAQLAEAGVEVRFRPTLYIHAKIVLVDRTRVFLGSQNFTATSLDQNRELGLILDEPAGVARVSQTFNDDFAASRPAVS